MPEIVHLVEDEDGSLIPAVINASVEHNMRTNDAASSPMRSVAFIGDTCTGKSYLTDGLGMLKKSGIYPATLPEGAGFESTTGGVAIYYSNALGDLDSRLSRVAFLDFEGENGRLPRSVLNRMALAALNLIRSNDSEYKRMQDIRNAAVKNYFPPLALLCSDVVILVTSDPLVNASTKQRVYELGVSCLRHLDVGEKPTLVVINNQCTDLLQEFDIEATTAEFKRAHDPDSELDEFFKNVYALRIPHTGIVKKRSNGVLLSGEEIAERQIANLRIIVGRELCDTYSTRVQQGLVLTEAMWYKVFKEVVSELALDNPVHMNTILSRYLFPSSNIVTHIMKQFRALYRSNDPSLFRKVRTLSFLSLARFCYSFSVFSKKTNMPEPSMLDHKMLEKLAELSEELWSQIENLAPCEAMYSSRRTMHHSTRNDHLRCSVSKALHSEEEHQTTGKISFKETRAVLGRGFWKWLFNVTENKDFFTEGIHIKWNGVYETTDEETCTELHSLLINTLTALFDRHPPSDSVGSTQLRDIAYSSFAQASLPEYDHPNYSLVSDPRTPCFFCFELPNPKHAWVEGENRDEEEPPELSHLKLCPSCMNAHLRYGKSN